MATSHGKPANGFVRVARKVYNPIGFSKGYNFILFFIFAGALLGFTLARFQYLNFNGVFCKTGDSSSNHAAPGECFYYLNHYHQKVGIILHLVTIVPAAFLVCVQFVPVIRHKAILFHRINGYAILLLSLLSIVGVFMIARNAFGGGLDTQFWIGFLAMIFIGSLTMAYINIKCLQIEQHRAWMLRAWFYACSIITLRLIMFLAAQIITRIGGYYLAMPCDKLAFILNGQNRTLVQYPECEAYFSGANPEQHALVLASLSGGGAEGAGAALDLNFGAAGWLALALHAIGVEIYLRLTPAEAERLRNVSYQRQLEAGLKYPGRSGLTADRIGDAELWKAKSEKRHDSETTMWPNHQ